MNDPDLGVTWTKVVKKSHSELFLSGGRSILSRHGHHDFALTKQDSVNSGAEIPVIGQLVG